MNEGDMAVVLFPNTQTAIQAEQVFRAQGIPCKLIPVPRHIATTCGLALRFPCAEGARVRQTLDAAGIHYGAIHEL